MGLREWVMKDNRSDRTFAEEIKKQLGDQTAHIWWGIGTGILPFLGFWASDVAIGVGWWGCGAALPISAGSIAGWEIRERKQAVDGSHVPWDPKLDSITFYTGTGIGIVVGLLLLVFVAIPKSV